MENDNTKTWILVIAATIIVGLGWWWYMTQSSVNTPPSTAPVESITPPPAPPTESAANIPGGSTSVNPKVEDTSDAALDQDLSIIDGQMVSLTSDTANVDKGMNDQPVSQAE